MQQRFVSDVSHELRTPLTTVRMAAEVLYDARGRLRPGDRRARPSCSRPSWTGSRPCSTDLLEICRFDAGAAVLDAEPRRPALASPPGRSTMPVPLADRHGHDARAGAATSRCIADVDARRIDRILRNLLVNARRARRGPPVEVTRGRDDDAVAVTVRDHGVGLRPGRGVDGLQPVLAGRPGAGPDHRRHRAGSGDRPGGRAAARRLAAGLGRAGGRLAASG